MPSASRPASRSAPIRDSSTVGLRQQPPGQRAGQQVGGGRQRQRPRVGAGRAVRLELPRPRAVRVAVDVGLPAGGDHVDALVGRVAPPDPHRRPRTEQVGDRVQLVGLRQGEGADRLRVPGERNGAAGQRREPNLIGRPVGVRRGPRRDHRGQRGQDRDQRQHQGPAPPGTVPSCHANHGTSARCAGRSRSEAASCQPSWPPPSLRTAAVRNGSAAAPGRMDADACMGRVTFAARRTVRPVAACGWVAPSACLHEAIRCMKQPSHPNHVHVREVKHMIAVADGHPRDLVPGAPGTGRRSTRLPCRRRATPWASSISRPRSPAPSSIWCGSTPKHPGQGDHAPRAT